MTYFVDASFLIALYDKTDTFHKKAVNIVKDLDQLSVSLITSNIALAETINLTSRHLGSKKAKKCLDLFRKSSVEEIFVPMENFEAGYDLLFSQKSKKDLGFFDCLHVATMKQSSIDTILTFDNHFKKYVKVYA